MKCPECGDLYAYHFEGTYTCPQGHTWEPEGFEDYRNYEDQL